MFMSRGLIMSMEEFKQVYRFFDRDGGGIDYGEFCWVYYNRRVIAAGTSDWADASGQVQAKKKAPRKISLSDARYEHEFRKLQREQAEVRAKATRVKNLNDAQKAKGLQQEALAKKKAQVSGGSPLPPSKSPSRSPKKAAFIPGGIYKSTLGSPEREPYWMDPYLNIEPIVPPFAKRKASWQSKNTPVEIDLEVETTVAPVQATPPPPPPQGESIAQPEGEAELELTEHDSEATLSEGDLTVEDF